MCEMLPLGASGVRRVVWKNQACQGWTECGRCAERTRQAMQERASRMLRPWCSGKRVHAYMHTVSGAYSTPARR